MAAARGFVRDGVLGVPVDADRAQVLRGRLEEYARLNPPQSRRVYTLTGAAADWEVPFDSGPLMDIEGVTGCAFLSGAGGGELTVYYDPAVITVAELDERIGAAGLAVAPVE